MDFGQPQMNTFDSTSPDAPAQEPIPAAQPAMGFADGFQFGCGFWAAAVVAGILTVLGLLILDYGLGFLGVNLF